MEERGLELKVGMLVLAALAGVLGLLVLMGELRLGGRPTLKVDFSHAGSVVKHAPVKLGGVAIGRVEAVRLTPTRRDAAGEPLMVEMEISVDPGALTALREDAEVNVATQGPLGEAYLELYPGTASAGPLVATRSIRGLDAPRIDLVTHRLATFLESATRVLEEDPQALSSLVKGVSGLTRTLEGVLVENRSELRTLVVDLSGAAKELKELSSHARVSLAPGGKAAQLIDDASADARLLREELPAFTRSANQTLGGLAALTSGLSAEDGARLKTALASYTRAGEQVDKLAARAERLLARLEAGEGSAGKALKDPQLYDDLKALVADLRKSPWKLLWKN